MHRFGAVLLAMAAAGLANSSAARTVEYLSDPAAIRAAAEDQGIPGPFAEAPGPGKTVISLETPEAADHRVTVASVICQAYHIDNPVSTLLQGLVTAANPPAPDILSSASLPRFSIRVLSGSTLLRCMNKDDFDTECKVRVRISAHAIVTKPDGTVATTPLVAQIERPGRVGGFCGNIARYTGIVTREAAIDLIDQARAIAGG